MNNSYTTVYVSKHKRIYICSSHCLILNTRLYCMSNKSWPNACSTVLYKMGHEFLDRRFFFSFYVEGRSDPDQGFLSKVGSDLKIWSDPLFTIWLDPVLKICMVPDPVWTSNIEIHLKKNFSFSIYWPKR